MKLEGRYTFDAPREVVWEAFLDPEILANTMPGCEKLERVGDNEFEGEMQVRVGPVQGVFQGTVKLSNLQAPESYRMKVSGKGPSGFLNGEGDVRLEESEEGTVMHYSGNAQVGGRIAQVGQRLMDSSARAITKQSLDNLAQQIAARQASKANGADQQAAAAPQAPSQTEFAVGVAREMVDDLVPAEQRSQLLIGGALVLGSYLVLRSLVSWWTDMLAQRVAEYLQE
ncbi:MAG TPA: carbon monoxide dehydrogenase subunit G [Candidatus Sulfomarinibacteraceae bacterium]|nr:carbon monoxide dehydrogenase subunit G [Candidatus Sulfomarinibacteraceae bacterium]